MVSAFTGPMLNPRPSWDDQEWLIEIESAERAVTWLLEAKRRTLRTDPQREHVLWCRYRDRLAMMKRQLDAACM